MWFNAGWVKGGNFGGKPLETAKKLSRSGQGAWVEGVTQVDWYIIRGLYMATLLLIMHDTRERL